MTADEQINPPITRPITLGPWLVTFAALVLYGVTLNHWVTLGNLRLVSTVTGWDWHPFPLEWRQNSVYPLFFVLTYPLRVLPIAWQPMALNIFSAVCAALTLGLLAASVRLLPHDRTREQRQREGGEFSLLSLRTAFLPPLFAVLMLGLQLTFWRNAIGASSEMLDVLVFAFLIYGLLKFRVTQNDKWLFGFAFLYGLGTSNNWALILFFPFFAIAMAWIKGLSFFNWRFILRVALWGVAGLLLYLLVPVIAAIGDKESFRSMLRMELGAQHFGWRLVPRWVAVLAAVPTLLPLIFIGIRWPSFEGELSAAGGALTRFLFRMLHLIFLLLALVTFFDFKYSPSARMHETPVNFLTFYYMGALCVGYFTGYLLLVFGRPALQTWERRNKSLEAFNKAIVGVVWLLALAAPCYLFYENETHIHASHSGALQDFGDEVIRDLPSKPAIVLSDDPERLQLLEAAYQRIGKPNPNILIDTTCFQHREYIAYLVSHYRVLTNYVTPPAKLRRLLPSSSLVNFLVDIRPHYSIYYLHPSFGYYFEAFYPRPQGLVYDLEVYPKATIQAPLPSAAEVKANEAIWAKLEKGTLAALPARAKLDPETASLGIDYSIDLDFWGVELQKAGYLREAGAQFAEAALVNPDNFVARINEEYNSHLQKNDHRPIDTGDLLYKAIALYRGLLPILKYSGPADEPDLMLQFGGMFAKGGNLRQAAGLFERRLQLLPNDALAELDLAKTFVDSRLPDRAMELVRKIQPNSVVTPWEITRVEALAYLGKNDFGSAEKLLLNALKENPQDENRVAILAEFYRATGNTALRERKDAEAQRRFKNALFYVNHDLDLLQGTEHTGGNSYDVGDALLKKAEIEMMMKSYEAGVATLREIIQLQPTNPTAQLNLAIAEMQLKKFDDAKKDYERLRKLMPQQSYVIEYGLADIASMEKKPAEEIHHLNLYLESAPDDTPEYQRAQQRLKKLEGH
jgi:tetratricopeptide (TPR) repeat protein